MNIPKLKAHKLKTCKGCRKKFRPMNTMQVACSVLCAQVVAKQGMEKQRKEAKKAEAKEMRQRRISLKTRREWMADAQREFNAYIRARDFDLPCISCGDFTPMTRGGDYDCGHYRSVGANPELRFEESNAHKQCKRCNSHLSGNIANYRIGLVLRIGPEKLDWLEGPHDPKHYSIDDLKALIATYKAKTKALKTEPFYPVAGNQTRLPKKEMP